jgi:hypothetical protein
VPGGQDAHEKFVLKHYVRETYRDAVGLRVEVVCRCRMEGLEACAARHVELSPAILDELHGALSQVHRGLLVPRVLARVVLGFDFWELILRVASVLDYETHLLCMIMLVPLWECPA